MFVNVVSALVVGASLSDEGRLSLDLMDNRGGLYFKAPVVANGGHLDSYCHTPIPGNVDQLEEEWIGAQAFVVIASNGDAVVLGTFDTDTVIDHFFAKNNAAREDEDGDESQIPQPPLDVDSTDDYPLKVSRSDFLRSVHKAQIVLGKTAGVVLDTTANEKPVRVQVASDSHLRISQAGERTSDHVVLASTLLERLAALESTLSDVVDRVNGNYNVLNTLICAGAGPGGAPTPVTSVSVLPDGVPLPPLMAWSKGEDATYKASAVRISQKKVSDE